MPKQIDDNNDEFSNKQMNFEEIANELQYNTFVQ